MKTNYLFSICVAVMLGFTSCERYLDINQDPNSPAQENVTSDMILSAVEMNIAATYAYNMHILGAYNVQYYAQQFGTPNYLKYSQFEVSASNSSGIYTQLFQRALGNINSIKNKALATGSNGVMLQAVVLRAYTYQLLVDAFGEVPYTQAFDPNIMAPKSDDGQVIYEGILKELDDALAQVKEGDEVVSSFIYPDRSLKDWIMFANALKLKLLTRMSGVKDVSADIKKIIDANELPSGDVQIAGCWTDAPGQANPLYSENTASWGVVRDNIIANVALINTMSQPSYKDPRLAAWYVQNAEGNFQGGISGTNFSTADEKYATKAAWSIPAITYDMPVILLARTEVDFFIAEYYARQGNAAAAEAAYKAAVTASFASAGVTGADENIAKFPYNQASWQESIGLAKWIALAGVNGFEGYTEARRLKYPAFGAVKGADMYAGKGDVNLSLYQPNKLYTPFKRFDQVGDNHLLARFPYPESSTARNSNSPAFPGYLIPVFWGK